MNGIYNKFEMLQGVINLLNELNISGQKNITIVSNVFQILTALQKGLKDEDEAKNKKIEILKEQLKRATTPEPENGGDVVGGEQYNFNFGGAAHDRNMV